MRRTVLGVLREGIKSAAKMNIRATTGVSLVGLGALYLDNPILGVNLAAKMANTTPREPLIIDFPENGDFDAYIGDRNGAGVIVDFYANWCNPCMEAMPRVISISEDEHRLGKKTDLLKVNVDFHEPLVERFDIGMIPCLVLIKNGKEVKRISGRQITEANIRELYTLGDSGAN